MSEEIRLTDANMAEIARLYTTIAGLRAELAQKDRCILAERRAREMADADNAALMQALEHAGEMFTIKGARVVARDALARNHPGAALLAELDAAREIVATLRRHWNVGGEVWGSIDRDFDAYDAAVKASKE